MEDKMVKRFLNGFFLKILFPEKLKCTVIQLVNSARLSTVHDRQGFEILNVS
jgi:hypothetical protein